MAMVMGVVIGRDLDDWEDSIEELVGTNEEKIEAEASLNNVVKTTNKKICFFQGNGQSIMI